MTELFPLVLSYSPFPCPRFVGTHPLSPWARYILPLHCVVPQLLSAIPILILGLSFCGECVGLSWEWVRSQHTEH